MDINEFILNLVKQLGVPYIDVTCYKSHEEIYRKTVGDGATGKELLNMYSCGKVITVTSALRLVEEGKMRLDDKVCKYIPEIEKAFILDENGSKKIIGDKMTIRHLFTMSAGFTYDVWTKPIIDLKEKLGEGATLRDFISAFIETPLSFEPGVKFQYSLCHDVLAAVCEVVSGKKFSEYVKEVIFTPLEMYNSYFDNSEGKVADMYVARADGKIERTDEGKILVITKAYESGGAGLVSTVDDFAIFADALACGGLAKNGYRVLTKETIDLLTTIQYEKASVDNGFTCIQGDDYGYGLGVRVRQNATPWGLDKGEFGWDGAACSYVMIDQNNDVSVFIGMHLREWPNVFKDKHIDIVRELYNHFNFNKKV